MKAKENITYAMINNQQVASFFTKASLKEWNEEQILAIPLTKAQEKWVKVGMAYKDGEIVKPSLDELKDNAILVLNGMFDGQIELLKGEMIPDAEILSWNDQEKEARAYLEHKTEPIFLKVIASTRNIPLDLLAQKVVQKADTYRSGLARIIAERQRCEDLIKSAQTEKELEQIEFSDVLNLLPKEENVN